jgi:hypothetical protein
VDIKNKNVDIQLSPHDAFHLGGALAKCDDTNTCVVNHDFQNCTGKYCERSRTKYNWIVEKLTEMTDWREHDYTHK